MSSITIRLELLPERKTKLTPLKKLIYKGSRIRGVPDFSEKHWELPNNGTKKGSVQTFQSKALTTYLPSTLSHKVH